MGRGESQSVDSHNLIQQLYQTSGGVKEKSRLSRRRAFIAALSFPFGKCDKGVWDPVSLPLPRHARKLLSCRFFLVLSFSFLSFHVPVKETNQVGMF